MGWREWLGLRMTPEQFARLVMERARAGGAGPYDFDPRANELRARPPKSDVVFLARIFAEYQAAPKAQRAGVLDRFVGAFLPRSENEIPAEYGQARTRLLPIVRHRASATVAEFLAQRGLAEGGREGPIRTTFPFAGHLAVGIGFDTPTAIQHITIKQMREWGVAAEDMLADAIDNLRQLNSPTGWEQADEAVWVGDWQDGYSASRLLTPEVFHQLGVPDPIVVAPTTNTLLVTSGRRPDASRRLAEWIRKSEQPGMRTVSRQAFRLQGDSWVPLTWEPGDPMRELELEELAGCYAEQKELFEQQHKDRGIDLFVASVLAMQHDDVAGLRLMSVWTQGVETLLPMTDWVVLQKPDGGDAGARGRLVVPRGAVSSLLERHWQLDETVYPPRLRTVGFPDSEQEWTALAEHAIGLPAQRT